MEFHDCSNEVSSSKRKTYLSQQMKNNVATAECHFYFPLRYQFPHPVQNKTEQKPHGTRNQGKLQHMTGNKIQISINR